VGVCVGRCVCGDGTGECAECVRLVLASVLDVYS